MPRRRRPRMGRGMPTATCGSNSADTVVESRVERRLHDIAVDPAAVEPVDVVVNRVVCCYPDYQRLLGAAADHATRRLVFSHPPRNPISRTIMAGQKLAFRLMGEFRTFAPCSSATD